MKTTNETYYIDPRDAHILKLEGCLREILQSPTPGMQAARRGILTPWIKRARAALGLSEGGGFQSKPRDPRHGGVA